jgi:hypothetical protein
MIDDVTWGERHKDFYDCRFQVRLFRNGPLILKSDKTNQIADFIKILGGDLQNFLGKFVGAFTELLFIENRYFMIYTVINKRPLMISASKSTLSPNNLKILRSKVTKNLKNFCKKFC